MSNLFWPIYKNLENELMSMTYQIHFDDQQLDVYSEKFIDLLLRTSIEIETLSKQLYLDNGGESVEPESEMFFDTVCLKYLDEKWKLSKKQVTITGLNFFFENKENRVLIPLHKAHKRGTSGSRWKQAYQAVKHNRNKNYHLGNMKNCIVAMAALYVLNLYYKEKDTKLLCGSFRSRLSIDENFGSQIFTPSKSYVSFQEPTGLYNQEQYEKDIFIEVFDNETYNRILKQRIEDFEKEKKFLVESSELPTFLKDNPDYDLHGKSTFEIACRLGDDFLKKYRELPRNADWTILSSQLYCILNCDQAIYTKEAQ